MINIMMNDMRRFQRNQWFPGRLPMLAGPAHQIGDRLPDVVPVLICIIAMRALVGAYSKVGGSEARPTAIWAAYLACMLAALVAALSRLFNVADADMLLIAQSVRRTIIWVVRRISSAPWSSR
jgi:hypothetical protein